MFVQFYGTALKTLRIDLLHYLSHLLVKADTPRGDYFLVESLFEEGKGKAVGHRCTHRIALLHNSSRPGFFEGSKQLVL